MPAQIQITKDPHHLHLRARAQSVRIGAVDAKAGRISGVSLLTADREAIGHGVWIDTKSLTGFHALLLDRKLKAYATHGASGGDGTLDEVGFWDGARIDGLNLRSDFTAFDAWRRHAVSEFETLFEIAEKLPHEFGASLSFSFKPHWVLRDGSEVPTKRSFSAAGEVVFTPPAPATAARKMPSVRVVDVYSADFVDRPAANNGLFSIAPGQAKRGPVVGLAKTIAATATKLGAWDSRAVKAIDYAGRGQLTGLAKAESALAAKLGLKAPNDLSR